MPLISRAVRRVILALVVLTTLASCGRGDARHLREWTPADHQPPEGDTTGRGGAPDEVDGSPAETEAAAAAALFGSMCATCHGADGSGNGPGRPPVAVVPDFRDTAWQTARDDEQLAASITDGRGGFMPPFGQRLSPEGVAALVRHVRRLAGVQTTPAVPAAPDAPAEEPAPAPPSAT